MPRISRFGQASLSRASNLAFPHVQAIVCGCLYSYVLKRTTTFISRFQAICHQMPESLEDGGLVGLLSLYLQWRAASDAHPRVESMGNGMHRSSTVPSSKDTLNRRLVERRVDLDRAHRCQLKPQLLSQRAPEAILGLVGEEGFGLIAAVVEVQGDPGALWCLNKLHDLLGVYCHGGWCRC